MIGGALVTEPTSTQSPIILEANRGANRHKPDPNAEGPHSTIKRDPKTGKVTGYQEWIPNPKNPTGFDAGKRYDGKGESHRNKDGTKIPTPHIHEPGTKDVRKPKKDENPK